MEIIPNRDPALLIHDKGDVDLRKTITVAVIPVFQEFQEFGGTGETGNVVEKRCTGVTGQVYL